MSLENRPSATSHPSDRATVEIVERAATAEIADAVDQPGKPRQAPAVALDGDAAVTARGVGKQFGDKDVVSEVTFDIPRGSIFGVIGPSGSGKTTAMRMMLGVIRPTSGEMRVLGREPHKFRRRDREGMGYLPQLFALFPELSVLENLNFAASVYGMNWFKRGRRVRTALDFVELWDARKRTASELSGGMQRRLGLAATLIHSPEIIFLDEPTAGIDPVLRAKFWERFRELRDEGRTLIVTTQYVTEAEYCDAIVVLKEGRLVANGTPDEVRRKAMGGELVRVVGPELGRRALGVIRDISTVRGIRRLPDGSLEVIVDDAGSGVPELIEALRVAGVEVDEIGEQRPTFDDVFVRLMEDETARAEGAPTAIDKAEGGKLGSLDAPAA